MKRNRVLAPSALCLTMMALSAAEASATSGTTLSVSVDGVPAIKLELVPFQLPNGLVSFTGSKTAGDGSWIVTWNITTDPDPEGNAYMTGTLTAENKTSAVHTYEVSVDSPLAKEIKTGTKVGGTLVLKLKTNADGGSLSCNDPRGSIYAATLSGKPVQKLFYCPFNMSSTGAATLTTTADFGVPMPSARGPQTAKSIGTVASCELTAGEKVTVTSLFLVAPGTDIPDGKRNPPQTCEADINGDKVVNSFDLGVMLSQWGLPAPNDGFSADINNDGIVDSGDLGILLSTWGLCDEQ